MSDGPLCTNSAPHASHDLIGPPPWGVIYARCPGIPERKEVQGPMNPQEMQNVEDQVVARYFPTLDGDRNEEQRIVYCLPDLGPSDPVARAAMLDYAKHFGDGCKCGHEKGLHHWAKLETPYCRVAICQCEEFDQHD